MAEIVFILNDNTIQLSGLTDIDGAFENAATVSVTLLDDQGVQAVGETWPVTMVYVANSNGDYRGVLRDALVLIDGDEYTAQIIADAGTDKRSQWDCAVIAKQRTCKTG